jgi:hypothetical protein
MEDLFRSYWWLLFPIMWFVFGAWDRWLSYRRSRDALDLIKAYTAQGKDPPAELLAQVRDDPDPAAYAEPVGHHRAARRYWRYRRWRGSPYWEVRSAVFTGVIAAALWVASEYAAIPGLDWPFRLAAIILGSICLAKVIMAVISLSFRGK